MSIEPQFSIQSFLNMLGGLAIFLLGLDLMATNLSEYAGKGMKAFLSKATDNKIISAIIGCLVTVVIQSSSATTSILVSFVHAGLISFARSVPIIMGANIGTTITGQIIAFKVTKAALFIIFIGFLINYLANKSRIKFLGGILMGLGLLFLGLNEMSHHMSGLRDSEIFLNMMQSCETVPIGILTGAIFTATIQSSSASIGIIIGMASQGLVTSYAAIPLVIGANIGTCITAILAALGTNNAGKKVAIAHTLFNISGSIIFAFFVDPFINLLHTFTNVNDVPRLIANGQTLFNIAVALVWLPFSNLLISIVNQIIIDEPIKGRIHRFAVCSIPDYSLFTGSIDNAIDESKLAINNLKKQVVTLLLLARQTLIEGDKEIINDFKELRERQSDFRLKILDFINSIGKEKTTYNQAINLNQEMTLVNEIENIAVQIENGFNTCNQSHQFELNTDHELLIELEYFYQKSIKYFSKSCKVLTRIDIESDKATKLKNRLTDLLSQERQLRAKLIDFVTANNSEISQNDEDLFLRILDLLASINSSSIRICDISSLNDELASKFN